MIERDTWNPTQYERFRAEREQPFHDLVALITRRPDIRAVDLGCGTGLLTAALHRELDATETIGVDSSDAMLERARDVELEGLRFERGDISTWEPDAPVDLVFSNAALQWLPDHPRLFERLTAMIAPGGELAVQVPANFDHVSHRLAADLAREEPFASAMDGYVRTFGVLVPEAYATLLHELGFAAQSVRMQVYGHVLEFHRLGGGMGARDAVDRLRGPPAGGVVRAIRGALPRTSACGPGRSAAVFLSLQAHPAVGSPAGLTDRTAVSTDADQASRPRASLRR